MLFRFFLVVCISFFITACSSDEQGTSSSELGGYFTLTSSSGAISTDRFRGKLLLVFFGYTHCPDVCPTTMSNVAAALTKLNEAEQKKVQVLFVTVDPVRDTAKHLAEYVAYFNSDFIGLTGNMAQLKEVARQYQVEFFIDKQSKNEDSKSYQVIHSARLFLADTKGDVVDMMSHSTSPDDIVAALRAQF
ncbi:MAG: SCO family protein [Mariprofundaceae bacterium]